MKHAWIENGRIRDLTVSDPINWHHPEVAKLYDTSVPDSAENGDFFANGQVVKPVIAVPEPVPPVPRQWTVADFRSAMSLAEKAKWDTDAAAEIVTVKLELPQGADGAQELVDFLVQTTVISQSTATKIMA
jgi:hypothetical protein